MLDVNVLAVAVSSKLAINSMLARGVDDGHVVNINRHVLYLFTSYLSSHMFANNSSRFPNLNHNFTTDCVFNR